MVVPIVLGLLVLPAGAQTPKKCDKGSTIQKQACWVKEITVTRKVIDTKIAEVCRKQAMAGGGSPKTEDTLGCRAERLAKIAESIN